MIDLCGKSKDDNKGNSKEENCTVMFAIFKKVTILVETVILW